MVLWTGRTTDGAADRQCYCHYAVAVFTLTTHRLRTTGHDKGIHGKCDELTKLSLEVLVLGGTLWYTREGSDV